MYVKILGEKRKIPDGWRRVYRGKVRDGDKVAWLENIGNPLPVKGMKWKNMTADGELGATNVKDFFCIIRKETHES